MGWLKLNKIGVKINHKKSITNLYESQQNRNGSKAVKSEQSQITFELTQQSYWTEIHILPLSLDFSLLIKQNQPCQFSATDTSHIKMFFLNSPWGNIFAFLTVTHNL